MKHNRPRNDIASDHEFLFLRAREYLKEQSDAFIEFVLLVFPSVVINFLHDNESDFLEYVESVSGYDTL